MNRAGHQMWIALVVTVLGAAWSCARSYQFERVPTVWQVEDDADIALPRERDFLQYAYFTDVFALRAWERSLELRDREPARNTNALDEVPDSSWFTNRIGARVLTPEEVATGPATSGPPIPPITIVAGKGAVGGNPGFIARDTTGRRFVVKFDRKENPEMQTGGSVVVNRFLWALGYNVPSDTIFTFSRDQLHIDAEATIDDEFGRERPFAEADLDAILAESPTRPDGSYRASASQFIDGIPVGGFAMQGRRRDDPNDVIDHEHRRELRGLRVFAAWLGHTDMKEDNTLDAWVEDGGRHYLRHYLLDFGEALGGHQAEKRRMEDGWEHLWDYRAQGRALLSFGLWKRPWEEQENTPWRSIGAFSAEHFDPALWREAYPYLPFHEADAADLFWGAKLVMRFDRATIEAVVAEARFSDSDAAEYLVETLIGRQRRIGATWLDAVTALDAFEVEDGELCATDLGVYYGLADIGVIELLGEDFDPEFDADDSNSTRDVREFTVDAVGRGCVPIAGDGYQVARLRIRRGGEFRPVMQVHYDGGSSPQILGIIRVER